MNQANYGKDFWQTEYDAETGLFELIYNVNQDLEKDSTATIKYYLGTTPPVSTFFLQSKINQNPLTTNSLVNVNERDVVVFDPLVNENGSQTTGNTGKWHWTGVNGYTADTRILTFNAASMSNIGNYSVTYTDTLGCSISATFQLTVNLVLKLDMDSIKTRLKIT